MEPAAQPTSEVFKRDYKRIALKYVRDAKSGKLPAGQLLLRGVERFERDLADKRWRMDWAAATKACRFAELCPYTDGPKARTNFRLEPWQVLFLCQLFGFKDAETGLRRFQRAHLWVGRGNGKSVLDSIIGLYMAFVDGEMSADVFSFASTREQARIVWDTAKSMMLFAPRLAEKLGIEVGQHALTQERNNSRFRALAAEANAQHGLRPHCLIIDELHVVDRELWEVLETSLTKRAQPILLTTSTAGYDVTSIGFTIFKMCQDILEGRLDAPRTLAVVYQADTDDLADMGEVAKAHPNLGVSVQRQALADASKKAQAIPSERNGFVTLQMNRWVSAREAWLKMEKWDAQARPELKIEDFKGQSCFVGLDMSQRNDLTAKAYVFVGTDDAGRRTYTVFFKCYLPEESVGRDARYRTWADEGHLTATPGDTIDFAQVEQELLEDATQFPGLEVCYDPQFMQQMAQSLAAEGLTAVEVRPRINTFNPAMKELEAAVYEGRLVHDGNPCAGWQVGNVTVKPNAGGMIYPSKASANQKIDAAYAAFTAMTRAMLSEIGGELYVSFH